MSASCSHLVRRAPPTPRPGVYELYWQFASKRQAAFEARLAGRGWPWSPDPILQTFKFCNVFRASDRVSQYLIRHVAYDEHPETTARDRVFQITAFRTFSNIATWKGIVEKLGGPPRLEHLRSGSFETALDQIKARNCGLYTGAFILCANKAFGFQEKHRNHVALFKHMFLESMCSERLLQLPSLRDVVELLQSFPLIGPFMAYQTAIDINYSDLTAFSENDCTQAGPGALRGLEKAFTQLGDHSPSDTILWMVDNQEAEFDRFGLPFHGLFGRPLHAIDCQGLFCELDKYCREAVPDLTSARSRIKARYRGSSEPIELFFPPKWRLSPSAVLPPAKVAALNAAPASRYKSSKNAALQKDPGMRDLFDTGQD